VLDRAGEDSTRAARAAFPSGTLAPAAHLGSGVRCAYAVDGVR